MSTVMVVHEFFLPGTTTRFRSANDTLVPRTTSDTFVAIKLLPAGTSPFIQSGSLDMSTSRLLR